MLELDPSDKRELAFALHKAVRFSGLSLTDISERMKADYQEELSISALSHVISRGTIRLQRALQILAVCGVEEVSIKCAKKRIEAQTPR